MKKLLMVIVLIASILTGVFLVVVQDDNVDLNVAVVLDNYKGVVRGDLREKVVKALGEPDSITTREEMNYYLHEVLNEAAEWSYMADEFLYYDLAEGYSLSVAIIDNRVDNITKSKKQN